MSMMREWEREQKGRHITDENHCQLYCSTATIVLSNMVANILCQLNKSPLTSFSLPSNIEGRIKNISSDHPAHQTWQEKENGSICFTLPMQKGSEDSWYPMCGLRALRGKGEKGVIVPG